MAGRFAILAERRFFGVAATMAVTAIVACGVATAIIPNPVLGRQAPPGRSPSPRGSGRRR